MGDWMDDLTPKERREWDDWVRRMRHDLVPMIEGSAAFMALCPEAEPDIKFAVELGLGIMLDKPILVVAMEGRQVPPGLRRVAHAVIEGVDFDTEAGQAAIASELRRWTT